MCVVEGCINSVHAKGFCKSHYTVAHRGSRNLRAKNTKILCEVCSGEFIAVTARARVCSSKCRAKMWKTTNPHRSRELADTARKSALKSRYGISLVDFERLKEFQKGVCAICGSTPTGIGNTNKNLHVDHNHKTNEIRGLLCSTCNTGLGLFKDSETLLRRAVCYLKS